MEPALPSAFPAIVHHPTSWNSPCCLRELCQRARLRWSTFTLGLWPGLLRPVSALDHTEAIWSTRLLFAVTVLLLGVAFLLPRLEASTVDTVHICRLVGAGCLIKSLWSAAKDSHKGQSDSDFLCHRESCSEDALVTIMGTSAIPMIVLRLHPTRAPA